MAASTTPDALQRLKVLIDSSTPIFHAHRRHGDGRENARLSTTRAEEIQALRQWAATRAVPASAQNASPASA